MAFGLSSTYLGNTVAQYLLFFGVIICAVIMGKTITWISKRILHAFADKTETKFDDLLLTLLEGPILFSILLGALYFGKILLAMSTGFLEAYGKVLTILFIFNVAWYLIRFLNGMIEYYVKPFAGKTKTDLDDHLLPIAKRLINVVVILIVAIMAIDKLGYNVASLLAGLGLGGLAFALAAKDLVGNLFGGVAILFDKPFKIGDRIKVGEVDGHVREIGLRTTRVETLAGTMIILPNSKVVDSNIENITAEKARRIILDLGVEYGTSIKRIEEAKGIIRKHVKRIRGLNDDCTVAFTAFNDSSLNLKVVYWINQEGMKDFWGVQDELNTAIKRDFEKARIGFAFPSRTVYVKK